MTQKNTARKTFATSVAPTLTATAADLVSVTINGKVVSGSREMILAILAGSEVPASKPATPANKPALVATPSNKSEGPKVSKSAAFTAQAVKATKKPEATVKAAMTAAHKAASKGDWSPAGREAFKVAYNASLKASLGITRY